MLPLSLKTLSTGLAVLLLSATVLGQTPARNLTIPSTATTTPSAPLQTSLSGGNVSTTPTNTPIINGTTTITNNNTQSNNSTTSQGNNTTAVKLTPVPDATGAAGSVPVPASTGGKPNGRYGPDDEYIASSVAKQAAPILSTFFIVSFTMAVISYGPTA